MCVSDFSSILDFSLKHGLKAIKHQCGDDCKIIIIIILQDQHNFLYKKMHYYFVCVLCVQIYSIIITSLKVMHYNIYLIALLSGITLLLHNFLSPVLGLLFSGNCKGSFTPNVEWINLRLKEVPLPPHSQFLSTWGQERCQWINGKTK